MAPPKAAYYHTLSIVLADVPDSRPPVRQSNAVVVSALL
jgi:hypothetical protein